jgi:hypothetical protein
MEEEEEEEEEEDDDDDDDGASKLMFPHAKEFLLKFLSIWARDL